MGAGGLLCSSLELVQRGREKTKQDLRMDLPTIGLQTFKDAKKYGLRGVVLQSKKHIFLDKTECIKFANKNKIFINII